MIGPPLRRAAWIPGLLFGVLASACSGPSERPVTDRRAIPVETAAVSIEDVDVVVEAVGSLEADQSIELKARRSGAVRGLPVAEGARVQKGTPLVLLDDRDVAARLDQARAGLAEAEVRRANAQRSYERSQTLRTKGVASEQAHDDATAEADWAAAALEVARANVAFAEAELAETVLEAPFAGVLGRLRVDAGAFVNEGEPLGLLVDDDPLEMVFSLPERYVARLREGLLVEVHVSSRQERPFRGRVTFVDPSVDRDNRTVLVKAEVPNPDRLMRPGQFGTVEVQLERHEKAVIVPEEAIVPTASRLVVFVVDDEMASARSVSTGVRLPGRVEVVSGLTAGDMVVVTGHEKLSLDETLQVRDVAAEEVGASPAD